MDCIFVRYTCDLSSRSFPMVAWHQGQGAGCSADSAPVPKKPWRRCGVSGASLGAITFQGENKLTTFVHCTSLVFARRKEKGRCERSCTNYTKRQMDANSSIDVYWCLNNDYLAGIYSHERSFFFHACVGLLTQGCTDMRNYRQAWKPPVVVSRVTESAP